MIPMATQNSNLIVFAKAAFERDFWRSFLLRKDGPRVFCFESETACFDNLDFIDPGALLLVTDSATLVWRFVFALHACKTSPRLLVLSDILTDDAFELCSLVQPLKCLPATIAGQQDQAGLWSTLMSTAPAVKSSRLGLLVGETPALKGIRGALQGLTKNTDPIMITGEKGTGKEHLARTIGNLVDEAGAFIRLDCGQFNGTQNDLLSYSAIGRGWWPIPLDDAVESNRPSILLLHNIHQLDKAAQSQMLLLLEGEGAGAQVRVIATSEVGLADMVARHRFRRDLFYRLNVIPFYLPPLRERKQDLPLLMDYFAIETCAHRKASFVLPSPSAAERLYGYPWPGNLDELRTAVQRLIDSGNEETFFALEGLPWGQTDIRDTMNAAFEMDAMLEAGDIQNYMAALGELPLKMICDQYVQRTEKKLMQKALAFTNWNRKRAAALLNISYKSMLNKMKNYEIV